MIFNHNPEKELYKDCCELDKICLKNKLSGEFCFSRKRESFCFRRFDKPIDTCYIPFKYKNMPISSSDEF